MDASIYDVPVDPAAVNNPHSIALRFIGSAKRVLEVGCATGHVTKALVAQRNEVVGVEIDPAAADKAAQIAERVVVADLDRDDLAQAVGPDSFDVVLFGDVLEHLRDPLAVLRAARTVLRPNGFVVVSVPNVAHIDLRLMLLSGRWDQRPEGLLDRTHVRFFTRAGLRTLLHDAGMAVTDVERVVVPAFCTELEVSREAHDPALVDQLLGDEDSETYQFVVRAVLDDGDAATGAALVRLAELEDERFAREQELTSTRQALAQREGEVADLRREIDELRAHHQRVNDELDALERTRTLRTVAPLRRLYRALRGNG